MQRVSTVKATSMKAGGGGLGGIAALAKAAKDVKLAEESLNAPPAAKDEVGA